MRELYWMVTFYIAIIFAVLKRNASDWSWHNQCIILWSMLLKSLCIIIYLYTGNTVTTKQIIESGVMFQTTLVIFALDLVIGLFISYICIFCVTLFSSCLKVQDVEYCIYSEIWNIIVSFICTYSIIILYCL